jgi:hypothetical protein
MPLQENVPLFSDMPRDINLPLRSTTYNLLSTVNTATDFKLYCILLLPSNECSFKVYTVTARKWHCIYTVTTISHGRHIRTILNIARGPDAAGLDFFPQYVMYKCTTLYANPEAYREPALKKKNRLRLIFPLSIRTFYFCHVPRRSCLLRISPTMVDLCPLSSPCPRGKNPQKRHLIRRSSLASSPANTS